MSTAVAEEPMLKCAECGRENETARIYCHDCGTKLDRASLAQIKRSANEETPEDAHRRLQGMFNARGVNARLWSVRIAKLVLGAGAAAIVLLAVLPPDVPLVVKSQELPAQINMDLEMMTLYHRPAALKYAEKDVNAFLSNALRSKKEALTYSILDFERALVAFTPGVCQATVERSIFGYSLYTTGVYRAEVSGGKLVVTPTGGAIGRLPIHPALAKYLTYLQMDVAGTMGRERRLLEKVGIIEFGNKEVAFSAATTAPTH